MDIRRSLLAAALALAAAAPAIAQTTMTSADAHELLLNDAGFRGVHDIEFRNGAWKAEAYDAYGDDLEIIVDADSGRILQVMDD